MKALLFDLDGVIVDTAKYHFRAWQLLAEQLNIPFTHQDNENLKGISRMASLDRLLSLGKLVRSTEEKEKLALEKNERYLLSIQDLSSDDLLPGVLDLLKSVRKEGLSIALGSASRNARFILEKLKIKHLFDAIIDGNDVQHAKPHPEVFLKGAKALGVHPCECVVFEDASAGVAAAINAGMKCVGIGNKADLLKADRIVNSLEEINVNELNKLFNRL